MPLEVLDKCPTCGLILLQGHIFDAFDQEKQFGPILGLHQEANKESAQAGYVGIGSLYDPEHLRLFYRCPRCGTDPVVEMPQEV
jgi:hypothetical protein